MTLRIPRHWPACALVAGLCLAGTAFAQSTRAASSALYQWKDAAGVTHYADAPPAQGSYTTRGINPASPPAVAASAPAPTAAPAADSDNCQLARSNLARLEAGGDIGLDADGDGKPDALLDAAQRDEQTRLAQANIEAYCSRQAAPATP